MKIIHCADLHLDSRLTGNLDSVRAAERRNEILATFRRMVKFAGDKGVSSIMIAGDMFDSNNVSSTAASAVYQSVLTHPNIDFYYLRGNHDSGSFLSSMKEIPKNLHLFKKEWTTYRPAPKVTVSGIEVDRSNYETAYEIPAADENSFNIVLLHGEASDSSSAKSPDEIPLAAFRNKAYDYLALGHYHTYHEEALDSRGKWCYCGCPEGRGFDETGDCGFVLLDTDTGESAFIPFASRKYFDIQVNISGCENSEDIAKLMTRDLQHAGANNSSLVKITLTGEISESVEINPMYLQKIFDQYFYFIKITDRTTLKINLDVYRNDNSLKGEFIRLVEGENELSKYDRSAIIRYGLKALKGEEIG